MSVEQFNKVAKMLFAFANQLSEKAYSNWQLKMQMAERDKATLLLKVSEEALKRQNDLFTSLLKNLQIGVFMVEAPSGKPLMANETARHLLGRGILPDATKNNLSEVYNTRKMGSNHPYPPEEMPIIIGMQGESSHIDDMIVGRPDGTETHLEIFGSPVLDEKGKVWASLVSFFDITDRKRIEDALIKSEKHLKDTQAIACLGTYSWDLSTGLWESSKILDEIFGIDESYIRTLEGWVNIIHPLWQNLMDDYATQYVIGMRQRFDKEYKIIRQNDGQELWVHGIGELEFDKNNNPRSLVGTISDITLRKLTEEKLKASEEKLSALFGSMTEMVVLHELIFNGQGEAVNYRITDCNHAFTEITGIRKEDAVGKLATEVYQTEYPPYLEEYSRVVISGLPHEYTTYFAPMDKYFMISAVSPSKNQFATISTDITDMKQKSELISTKNKELENYLYIASHDLRSPLVNIQGFSQRLQKQSESIKTILTNCAIDQETRSGLDKITNGDIPKTLNFIFSNVTKMDSLINGLLQISRTGRMIMSIYKVDMNNLFKTIISAHNFQISELRAKVIIEDLCDCFGDENQLNQLFSNIIGNAIKYADKSRPLVLEIASSTHYNKVIYSIKDTGIGIAARQLDRIWEVFYQVDPHVSSGGEGIGLSLAKRIADKHKGKIWAESEEGKGSTFYIELQKNEFSV